MRVSILAALLLSTSAFATPTAVTHQGRLFDSLGAPLGGQHSVQFTLYDAAASGSSLWTETSDVDFTDGYYDVVLGETQALDNNVFTGDTVWLGLAIDGGPELTRIPAVSVPYAIHAELATSVSGGIVDATEIRVDGTTVIDGSGQLLTSTPHTTDASALITGTLAIERLPVGTGATEVAPGDHNHALSALTGVITSSQLPTDFGTTAIAAMGSEDPTNPLNHARYSDADAVGAMGSEGPTNPLNHARYSDADAVAAMGTADAANPLNHDRYEAADAVADISSELFHRLTGQYIKLYGAEITLSGNNAQQNNPHLNITATRSNHIGSSSFELVGANHCNYCYSSGPKAVIWSNGNVPFTYYVNGDSVYVQMDASHIINIRSSYPIAPSVVSAIPAGSTVVAAMN